jgi:hypothetical protein
MLKQETRERLQSLVYNPSFSGSVGISDAKYSHCPTAWVTIDIHGQGFNVFTLLAELFPDMKVSKVKSYETDQGEYFTFGSMADGKIEEANVNIWATYGKRVKEIAPATNKGQEEFIPLNDTIFDAVEEEKLVGIL